MITAKINIVVEICCVCGVPFGMPDYLANRLKNEGGSFYCPSGHRQHFAEPANTKLQQQIDWYRERMKEDKKELEATKNSLRSTKAAHTRTKNRIKNGVCPCCNRHFENLQRHIATEHPEYRG